MQGHPQLHREFKTNSKEEEDVEVEEEQSNACLKSKERKW